MKTIDYSQLKNALKEDVPVINVLPAETFQKSHIPGSVNIPLEDNFFVEQAQNAIGEKNAPVVVYCANSDCEASKKAATKLEQAGFSNVMCYEGGMKEWQEKTSMQAA